MLLKANIATAIIILTPIVNLSIVIEVYKQTFKSIHSFIEVLLFTRSPEMHQVDV